MMHVFTQQLKKYIIILQYVMKWLFLSLLLGGVMGGSATFFLKSLAWVTQQQNTHFWLLFLLPIGGGAVSFLYQKVGKNAGKGNNLVIEQANGTKQEEIPLRMIPLTLLGTLVTHLFGGSAGREGTAVQMGGAAGSVLSKLFHLHETDRKLLLICGISAGFSSVFGTPLAGTIFSLEVLAMGRIRHEALLPSFFSAYFANLFAIAFGAHHIHYSMGGAPLFSLSLLLKLFIAGLCFGLTGWLFERSLVLVKKCYQHLFPNTIVRSVVGGLVIVILTLVINSRRYLGLSLAMIDDSFIGQIPPFAFIGKLIFTVLTLGAGFQGGEVTPLFDIGSSLGSSLSHILSLPTPFLTGLGFIGVFVAATNTPIACFIMGIELFGSEAAIYLFLISVISYLFSGNSSIYSSQKIEITKFSF